jgi:Tfp pilus assembly protein PilF
MRLLVFIFVACARGTEPGYTDPARCRPCHQAIFDSYAKTGMGRSFSRATDLPGPGRFVHQLSGRSYSTVHRDGKWFLQREQSGDAAMLEKSLDYAIGSGNHSRTYIHRDERGRLTELPVSWYAERGGYWAMSPGYDRPDHSDFRRKITDSCLFCHNGYPSEVNGGQASGIDCQRCHGPGEGHASRGGPIVNPARLSTERQMEVCMQCHLESASRTLPDAVRRFDRVPYSYPPGEPLGDFMVYFDYVRPAAEDRITVNSSAYGLIRSSCFVRSAGRMTCTTCHNPHADGTAETRQTKICRDCHPATHSPATTGCAGCHMQKRRTEDAVHVVMTDHFIRRQPLSGDLEAPLTEKHDRQRGPVRLLYPERLARTADNQLIVAVAQASAASDPRVAIAPLEQAIAAARPRDAQPYIVLADAYRQSGRIDDAIRAYRDAAARNPGTENAYAAQAELLLAKGQIDDAQRLVESAMRMFPEAVDLPNTLSVMYGRRQRFDDAIRVLTKAAQANPDEPLTWLNLGVCLQAKGEGGRAEAAYRKALQLQPEFEKARLYLSRLKNKL